MMRAAALLLGAALVAGAQNGSPELLEAARAGKPKQIEKLLAAGADIESHDKEGLTALMLAARHGHAAAIQVLLAKGANPAARDPHGWDAFMWALLRGAHENVLKLLPQPRRFRLAVTAGWQPGESAHGSCFLRPENLTQYLRQIRPDAMILEAFQRFAAISGRDLIAVVQSDALGTSELPNKTPLPDLDATLFLTVEPVIDCSYHADRLSLRIRAALHRSDHEAPILARTFEDPRGRSESAGNPNQYPALFAALVTSQVRAIYWPVVTALLGGVE